MTIVNYKNTSIAVLGFGVEGKAVVNYFYKNYPDKEICVIDESLNTTKTNNSNNIHYISGKNSLDCLIDFDIVFISPGISIYRNEIVMAKQSGVLFSSASQLWYDHHKDDLTIFVTGTKGKSTTSSLIHHVLNKLNDNVHLIGNIGIPAVDKVDMPFDNNIWIVELSSFQSATLKANPDISILLNLYPEHIDWHGSVEQYYRDKLRIIANTTRKGTAIINYKNKNIISNLLGIGCWINFNDPSCIHHRDNRIYNGKKIICQDRDIPLNGNHNLENICAMLCVIEKMGIEHNQAIELLHDYHSLPHRMQEFATINGVLFVDDSISTIPQSAMEAINYYEIRNTTLILGGLDRGLDWGEFSIWLSMSKVSNIIGLPDTGHTVVNNIRSTSNDNKIQLFIVDDLEDAVSIAKKLTPTHGVVLLTPASPSQNKYRDYKERGDLFKKFVLQ